MPLSTDEKMLALSRDIIEGFDKADGGVHPGFRPAHAKGILLAGVFTPSADSRLAYARPTCPAGFHTGDGALLGLRGNSDCSR